MKTEAIICGLSVAVTGFIVNVPRVRSRLKTPLRRAAASGLLAAVLAAGGLLIARLMFAR